MTSSSLRDVGIRMLFVGFLSILVAKNAIASDNFGFVLGNNCQALDSKQGGDFSRDEGRLTNVAGGDREAICNIDNVSQLFPSRIRVLLNIYDASNSSTFSCTLHARDQWAEPLSKSNIIIDFPDNNGSHEGPTFVGKAWTSYSLSNFPNLQEVYFYLWCRLPPQSSIRSFRWTTNN